MSRSAALRRDRRKSVDLVAAWGAEQGLLAEDPRFAAFMRTFAPACEHRGPDAYRNGIYAEIVEIGEWKRIKRPVDLRRMIAAAMIAGALGQEQPLDDGTEIRAVGLAYPADDYVRFVDLDLDGQIPPANVVAALCAELGKGALHITSGSGKPGRYRVRFRLAVSLSVQAMQVLAKRLLVGLGFVVGKGAIEIYPSTTNGRLPFGAGGCVQFSPDLEHSERKKPLELADTFSRLPAVDLGTMALRYPEPANALPAQLTGSSQASSKRAPVRPSLRCPATPPWVSALWIEGIKGPGERDAALYALCVDCLLRGLSEGAANDAIKTWIGEGKLDCSSKGNKPGFRVEQIADVSRRVRHVYETHPRPGRPLPVPLTASEVRAVAVVVKRVSIAIGQPSSMIGRMLWEMLPLFKGARAAGLGGVRIHCHEWEASGGARYAKIRTATGLFAPVTGYLPQKHAARPELAHAMKWITTFQFDEGTPTRPIGKDWRSALLAAQRKSLK